MPIINWNTSKLKEDLKNLQYTWSSILFSREAFTALISLILLYFCKPFLIIIIEKFLVQESSNSSPFVDWTIIIITT
ncbi:MAG: hypothetical protein MI810_10735, partial [Flavobacteriales bacterium]|nr:hypothetical protein [Flavobacteriales bacterium]